MNAALNSPRPQALMDALPVGDLFDCLPDTVFFIKDVSGRYVLVNDTLAARCRGRHKGDLVGKLPSEVLGRSLGDYRSRLFGLSLINLVFLALSYLLFCRHPVIWDLQTHHPASFFFFS